jgi:tetratricopeptide (TPR) repeat protein
MNNKICVYAISKNEEKFVDTWYNSMKEADSVVVLDTGSTDNTVSRLRELGATVVEKVISPWRFDLARNEAMKLAPEDCNILVSTDLDEVLEAGWSKYLRDNWIEGKHERAVYKYIWSHLDNGEEGRVFKYNKIHSRNWEWRAPVHELLYNRNTNSNNYYIDSTLDLFDKITLHHYPDKNKSRASYLPLLELRVKENPDDYYGSIYLAHEYYYRQKYAKSVALFNKILDKFSNKINTIEKASCYLFIGDNFKALLDIEEDKSNKKEYYHLAYESYLNAIDIDHSYREPYLNLAKLLISVKEYMVAISYIKTGLSKSYRHYTWLERDTSWSYEPWDLLSLATWYGGKKKEALSYAAKALSFEPTNKRLQDNLKICSELITKDELLK